MLGYFNKIEMSWAQVPVCFNFKFLFGRCCMKREIFMASNGTTERKKIPVLMYGKTLFPIKSRACTFSKDVLGLQSSSSSEMWLQKHLWWHWSRLCREAGFRWKSTYGACTDTGASCCAVTRSTIAHPMLGDLAPAQGGQACPMRSPGWQWRAVGRLSSYLSPKALGEEKPMFHKKWWRNRGSEQDHVSCLHRGCGEGHWGLLGKGKPLQTPTRKSVSETGSKIFDFVIFFVSNDLAAYA